METEKTRFMPPLVGLALCIAGFVLPAAAVFYGAFYMVAALLLILAGGTVYLRG